MTFEKDTRQFIYDEMFKAFEAREEKLKNLNLQPIDKKVVIYKALEIVQELTKQLDECPN